MSGRVEKDSPLIPSNMFYGRKDIRKRKAIENSLNEKEKESKLCQIPDMYRPRLTGPISDWKVFYRQQDAYDYAHSRSKELQVFAFERCALDSGDGKRMFLVTSYPAFWHYYRQLSDNKKMHYEIIPEGAVCKLYFDLEFSTAENPNSNGKEMVDTFIQVHQKLNLRHQEFEVFDTRISFSERKNIHDYVCWWLDIEYQIKCSRKNVLDLDASTSKKFSRHLVFIIPNTAFQNNINAGNFVHHIMLELKRYVDLSTNNKVCNVAELPHKTKDHDSKQQTNCQTDETDKDLSVRLHKGDQSTKEDKCETCAEQKECVCHKQRVDNTDKADMIFKHFKDEDLSSLFILNKQGEKTPFCDLGVYTKNRNFRLFMSSKCGKNNPLQVSKENQFQPVNSKRESVKSPQKVKYDEQIFLHSLVANVEFSENIHIMTFDGYNGVCRQKGNSHHSSNICTTVEGFQASPFPELDQFISSVIQDHDTRGGIRHWMYFSQGELIVYEIANYRWCQNIGRSHKSNNIMYIVDLKKRVYYQKCHDPVCKSQNFKSQDYVLPPNTLPTYDWEDDEFFDGEDEELCQAVSDAEFQLSENSHI